MDADGPDDAIETVRVRIRGRVQGVGLRDGCLRQARAAGLTGWVRNRTDGSVEALLQGPPRQLAALCGWLRAGGVPAARVDAVEVEAVPAAERRDGFERLPTC